MVDFYRPGTTVAIPNDVFGIDLTLGDYSIISNNYIAEWNIGNDVAISIVPQYCSVLGNTAPGMNIIMHNPNESPTVGNVVYNGSGSITRTTGSGIDLQPETTNYSSTAVGIFDDLNS
jgi:hypothetical protein